MRRFTVVIFTTVAISAVFAWLYFVYFGHQPGGLILVSPPQVFARERLVNQTFLNDSWLRDRLAAAEVTRDILDRSESKASSSNIALDVSLSRAPSGDNGSKEMDTANAKHQNLAKHAVEFSKEFRYRSALRDLIQQKILENQLDDIHDINGNTIIALKFDASVVRNAHSNLKAFIGVGVGNSKTLEPEQDNELYEQWLRSATEAVNSKIKQITSVLRDNWSAGYRNRFCLLFERQFKSGNQVSCDEVSPPQDSYDKFLNMVASNADPKIEATRAINEVIITESLRSVIGKAADRLVFRYSGEEVNQETAKRLAEKYARSKPGFEISFDEALPVKIYGESDISGRPGEVYLTLWPAKIRVFNSSCIEEFANARFDLLDGESSRNYYIDADNFIYATQLKKETSGKIANLFIKRDDITQGSGCSTEFVDVDIGLREFSKRLRKARFAPYSVLPRQSIALLESSDHEIAGYSMNLHIETAKIGGRGKIGRADSRNRSGFVANAITTSFALPGSEAVARFGWVINPAEDPENWTQASVQETLTAVVSVPAWLDHIDIDIETGWLRDTINSSEKMENWEAHLQDRRSSRVSISLQRSFGTLNEVFSGRRREPAIYKEQLPRMTLRACEPADIIIPGFRVWRNSVVTLDGYRANQIVVMPDMEGILAQFLQIPNPTTSEKTVLRVWTSEGATEALSDKIVISNEHLANSEKGKACVKPR